MLNKIKNGKGLAFIPFCLACFPDGLGDARPRKPALDSPGLIARAFPFGLACKSPAGVRGALVRLVADGEHVGLLDSGDDLAGMVVKRGVACPFLAELCRRCEPGGLVLGSLVRKGFALPGHSWYSGRDRLRTGAVCFHPVNVETWPEPPKVW